MNEQTDYIVLTCGSETIRIETNDILDTSDSSETNSSLTSESDYEEIELESHLLYNKTDSNVKLKNPYIKLVRCDHLLTNGATVVLTPRLIKRHSKGCRTSLRKKRPTCFYEPDDFHFDKNVNTKITRTRKACRPRRKSFVSSSRIVNTSRKQVSRTVNVRHYEKFNFTVSKDNHAIGKSENVNKNNIGLGNSEIVKNVFLARVTEENPTLKWQDVTIKTEPFDSYFNNTSEMYENRDDILNYVVKQEPNENLHNETENNQVSHNKLESSVKTEEKTCDQKITEAAEKSDDSEVDIENYWDCSKFRASQKDIDFDHCYHLPHDQMRSDDTGAGTWNTSGISNTPSTSNSRRTFNIPYGREKGILKKMRVVFIICKKSKKGDEFLITQILNEGSYGGRWRFPSCIIDADDCNPSSVNVWLYHGIQLTGKYTHSSYDKVTCSLYDLDQPFRIETLTVAAGNIRLTQRAQCKWIARSEVMSTVSRVTAKVFKIYEAIEEAEEDNQMDFKTEREHRMRPKIKMKFTHHSALERERRKSMAILFRNLRDEIPEVEGNERIPKLSILKKATEFIRRLKEMEAININTLQSLKKSLESKSLRLATGNI